MLAARPEVEVEPVVGHVEPLPGVGSEAARQWRQSLVISAQSRQDEGPVEVDGAGRRWGVLYHGGPELQPDGLREWLGLKFCNIGQDQESGAIQLERFNWNSNDSERSISFS